MATVNEKMTAIADAIRDKTGGTEALTLDGMAENISEVYEAGKKAEYDEFWDNVGTRSDYRFAGTSWTKYTFKPTKDFKVGRSSFYYHNWQGSPYNLAVQLEELGVTMTIISTGVQEAFRYAWFTRIPKLDFTPCSGMFDRVFYGDVPLVTIDKIILPPEGKITSFNAPFGNCSGLENITFEGVIDRSISFSASPLTVASMKNIISCLKNYAGTDNEGVYSVTFTSACKTALEAEGNTSPNGNTWTEYITNLGWIC